MNHMKKVLVLGLAMLGLAGAAAGATHEIGVKGGVAIQELGGDGVESDQMESRTGFAGGAYFQSSFSQNFGVRVEALYFMKGASADSAGIEAKVKLDYIEFPVLLVAHIPFSDTGRLSLFGGPTFGLNTKAELEGSVDDLSATLDIDDLIKSFDLGLTFGAGISFDAGSAVIGVDGRYGFGLNSVIDEDFFADNDITTFENDDVKNQGFAVMASVGIRLGEE